MDCFCFLAANCNDDLRRLVVRTNGRDKQGMPRTTWHLLLPALMALVASAQAFSAPPFLVRLFGAVACDQSLMLSAVALDRETGDAALFRLVWRRRFHHRPHLWQLLTPLVLSPPAAQPQTHHGCSIAQQLADAVSGRRERERERESRRLENTKYQCNANEHWPYTHLDVKPEISNNRIVM